MKLAIATIELRRLELFLVEPFVTAHGTTSRRPILLVRLETTDGTVGIGECDALFDPSYSAEYADGAEDILSHHIVPRLFEAGASFDSTAHAMACIGPLVGHRMARAALEMALFDAELRRAGRSLFETLGATRTHIDAGATIGLGAPDVTLEGARTATQAGYRRLKVKIQPGHDALVLSPLRREFPSLDLQVDANGSYRVDDRDDRAALRDLDRFGLLALEQPLRADDLVGHATLRREIQSPIVLDESIDSPGSFEAALALGALDGVSLKPARVGGIAAARRLHDRCLAEGVHLAIGGMLEAGVGRAVALSIGALPGFDLPGDIGGTERYFARDITAPFVVSDGLLAVPDAPGIGVEVDWAAVEDLTKTAHTFAR